MNAEIICVGTELLLGDILNTNAKFLSEKMAELGFNLFSQSVVGDNAERLERQIAVSLSRSNIVILSGGLGPTEDDITKETVAKVLNLELEENAESLKRIESYFALTGRTMTKNNKKQALIIKGATAIQNDHGTAPGIFLEVANGAVILLPGPPSELVPMFNNKVVPMLKKYSNSTIVSHNIRIFGVGESAAAEICGDLLKGTNPTVATYAKTGEVDIRVTASAESLAVAKSICAPVTEKIKNMFGNHVYGVDVENLQEAVVELLKSKGMKLATAESCTAGMLSERITEVAGASEVFEMGVTAYANYIKVQALGVDSKVIDKKGAVSDEVAAQMAKGIRAMCGADIGVGITGVAGPGQSEGKPAGLVYVAIADSEKVFVRKIMARGSNRDTTRILATSTALDMVRRYLEGCKDLISFGTAYGEPLNVMERYEDVHTATVFENTKNKDDKNIVQIYTDEELMDMFNTVDETIVTEELPEKLEIDDGSINFIFDDDDITDPDGNDYYKVGDVKDLIKDKESLGIEENQPISRIKPVKKRSFWASVFPCSADSVSEKIRKSIFIIAFLVLIVTTICLINYFVEGWSAQEEISSAAKVWKNEESMNKNEKGFFTGFEELLNNNKDVKAWIKIDGTNVNNPVYKTNNNEFYLNHDMNKQSSRYGALFIDKDASITEDRNSQNVVIYGHNMKDGTMFGQLKKYTDISFYKTNSIIDFTTLYRDGRYKVFSVFITNTLKSHDDGAVFDYCKLNFESEEEFLNFIAETKKRSIINTGVEVLGDDEIITLSTCTYEFDDARLVVMARKLRDSENEVADTSKASVNPNPLYPQIWYDIKGGKKPYYPNTSSTISSDMVSSEIASSEIVSSEETSSVVDGNSSASSDKAETSSNMVEEEEILDFNVSVITSQTESASSQSITSVENSSEASVNTTTSIDSSVTTSTESSANSEALSSTELESEVELLEQESSSLEVSSEQ